MSITPDVYIEAFGRRMTVLRERSGLSRTEFAGAMGVSRQALYAYEHGDQIPSTFVLHKLQLSMPVNLNWLVSGLGDMQEDDDQSLTSTSSQEDCHEEA